MCFGKKKGPFSFILTLLIGERVLKKMEHTSLLTICVIVGAGVGLFIHSTNNLNSLKPKSL